MPANNRRACLTLGAPRVDRRADGGSTLSCDFELSGRKHSIYFKVSSGPIAEGIEPFLTTSLLSAMKAEADIVVDDPVSPMLMSAVPDIVSLFSGWFPEFKPVTVEASTQRPLDAPSGRGVASFFSGGVDSFYSLLEHIDEITCLIFVTGFDIDPSELALAAKVRAELREAAKSYGKRLIEVETNLRSLANIHGDWASHQHGAALAAVAHVLAPQISKVYIPSSFSREQLRPHGSHPDLDPLWSSEAVKLLHDGLLANRVEKIAMISQNEVAMRHLRVCWENRGKSYNCGRCEKCLRTMVAMRALGILDQCKVFDAPLSLSAVSRIAMAGPTHRTFFTENLDAIRARGGDPPLEKAIQDCLNDKYYRGAWKIGRQMWRKIKNQWK